MAKKEKGKAVARRGSTDVTNWKEELAREAQEESSRVPAAIGNKISLRKNMQFRVQGSDEGGELEAIIVGHVYDNSYYDKDFDEDNPGPPACKALSVSGDNMAPFENSPAKQAQICEECWAFEWKSDKRGKGRACKNKHALALVLAADIEEEDPEVYFLDVPVTSGKAFRKYVKKISENKVPSWAVITNISFDSDADWQKLEFELSSEVPEKHLSMARAKNRTAMKTLMEPPDFSGYVAPKGAKSAKGGKTTSKKRSRLS